MLVSTYGLLMLCNTAVVATSMDSAQIGITVFVEKRIENQSCNLKILTSNDVTIAQTSLLHCEVNDRELMQSAKNYYLHFSPKKSKLNDKVITIEIAFQ